MDSNKPVRAYSNFVTYDSRIKPSLELIKDSEIKLNNK